jgi:hypothetical protein
MSAASGAHFLAAAFAAGSIGRPLSPKMRVNSRSELSLGSEWRVANGEWVPGT